MNSVSNGNTTKFDPNDVHVQEVVRTAQTELRVLLERRAELMKRIGSIKQTLAGLVNIFGKSLLSDELLQLLDRKPSRQSGFTRACRAVLMESPGPLRVREVCDELRRKFPGLLERHREPVASVTTVLSRLVAYDEVRSFMNEEGKRVWQWTAYQKAEVGGLIPGLPTVLGRASNQA